MQGASTLANNKDNGCQEASTSADSRNKLDGTDLCDDTPSGDAPDFQCVAIFGPDAEDIATAGLTDATSRTDLVATGAGRPITKAGTTFRIPGKTRHSNCDVDITGAGGTKSKRVASALSKPKCTLTEANWP